MTKPRECECSDSGCPHVVFSHNGRRKVLYHIDMEDQTGTLMCETCRNDAIEVGLFTEERPSS